MHQYTASKNRGTTQKKSQTVMRTRYHAIAWDVI